jgi:hypothetical protein
MFSIAYLTLLYLWSFLCGFDGREVNLMINLCVRQIQVLKKTNITFSLINLSVAAPQIQQGPDHSTVELFHPMVFKISSNRNYSSF